MCWLTKLDVAIQDICVLCVAMEVSKPVVAFEAIWLPGPINSALYNSGSQQVSVTQPLLHCVVLEQH